MGAALLARVVYLFEISSSPLTDILLGDAQAYDKWAMRIASGDWIGAETFYQAPLYPYFLGIIYAIGGHHVWIVRGLQALMGAVGAGLLGVAGERFFDRRAGLAAGLLMAVYPPALFFDAIIQKSALDSLFVCLLLFLLAPSERLTRPQRWWGIGAVTAMLVLTRENALALVAVLPMWLWYVSRRESSSRRAALAGAFVLGLALLLPVALRNHRVGGEFHLTTSQFGPNLYIGNHHGADGLYEPLRFGRGDALYERQDAIDIAEEATGRKLTPGEVSSFWTRRVIDYIRESPIEWARLMGRKALLTFNAVEIGDTEDIYTYADWSLLLRWGGALFHFGLLVPLAAAGAVLTWRRIGNSWVLHALTWTLTASIAMFFLFARYRYPLTPMLMLWAGACVGNAATFVRERFSRQSAEQGEFPSRRYVLTALLVGAFAAVLANLPLVPMDVMRAASLNNLGFALTNQGRAEEAAKFLSASLELMPKNVVAINNLGGALAKLGRPQDAERCYLEAIRIKPDFALAHYNLGGALAERKDYANALRHYTLSSQLQPRSASSYHNMGFCLAALGKPDEALAAYRKALEINPNHAEALNSMGISLAQRGDIAEAHRYFTESVKNNPDNTDARFNLANAALSLGRSEDAAREFALLHQKSPGELLIRAKLGVALAQCGRDEEAAGHLATAVAGGVARPDVLTQLAWIQASARRADLRNPDSAVRLAERAAELTRGNDPRVLDALAAAFAGVRRWDDALRTVQRAAELFESQGSKESADAARVREALYRKERAYFRP